MARAALTTASGKTQRRERPPPAPKSDKADTPGAAVTATAVPEAPAPTQPTFTTMFVGGLFVLAAIAALYLAHAVLVPMVAAALLAMTLMPAVNRLRRWRIPHALAVTIVGVALVATFVGLAFLLIDPLGKALNAIPALDGVAQRLTRIVANVLGQSYTDWLLERLQQAVPDSALSGQLFGGLGHTGILVLETLVLTFFLLLSGDLFLQKLVHVLPRIGDKVKAVKVVNDVQEDVSRYLATVTIVNTIVGTVAGTIAWYWELPAPLLIGVLAGLFNYIPYLGAITNTLLLTLASCATYTSLGEIFAPPATFAAFAMMEGNFITPLIVGKRTQLNPVTVVFGLLFWAWLWGIAGMVLAIPLLLVIKGFAVHIERLEAVNEFLSR